MMRANELTDGGRELENVDSDLENQNILPLRARDCFFIYIYRRITRSSFNKACLNTRMLGNDTGGKKEIKLAR